MPTESRRFFLQSGFDDQKTRITMSPESGRMPLIDALKGVAAQIILLHHLVSYGPLAESLGRQFPLTTGVLFDYGRMVVQVFLVIAGFLAAKALAPELRPRPANPFVLIWKRYLRLAPAFIAAMALAVAAAAVARQWTASDAVPAAPTLLQFLAHALMLHGVVDVPSLSAGVWYVAIDLQLYALFVILLTLGSTTGSLIAVPLLVGAAGLASLFFFNRDPGWDAWAIYFFGSYSLGAMAWWASRQRAFGVWMGCILIAGTLALMLAFRERILIALTVAMVLAAAARGGWLWRWPDSRLLGWLGRVSYSVFLIHFPVCLIANGVYERFTDGNDLAALAASLAAIVLSTAAGAFFHRHVENRRSWLPRGSA